MSHNSRPTLAVPSHPARRLGFTLVELLVVIGIIALLISILLPSLNRARQAAYRISCASNQRQIIMAILMYATEHQQFLPGPAMACVNDPRIVNAPSKTNPPGKSQMDVWNTGTYYSLKELSSVNLMQRYLGGPTGWKVWMCTSNQRMWETATPTDKSTYFSGKVLGYSYMINNSIQTAASNPSFLFGSYTASDTETEKTPKRIGQIRYPTKSADNQTVVGYTKDSTKIWLITDIDGRNFSTFISQAMGVEKHLNGNSEPVDEKNKRVWQPVHNYGRRIPDDLGRNYGYLDGHVELVGYGDWPASSASNSK